MRPSVGSLGDAYDNVMAESFFSTRECELLARRKFASKAEARLACVSYVEGWYNPVRLHARRSPIADEQEHLQMAKVETRSTSPSTVHRTGAVPLAMLA